MKEEYEKELNSILELFQSNDWESQVLGVGLFIESKWVQDIKRQPDYYQLVVQDFYSKYDSSATVYPLANVLDFLTSCSDFKDPSDNIDAVARFVAKLLKGEIRVAFIIDINSFSK